MVRLIVFLLFFTLLWAEYLPDRVLVKIRPAETRTYSLNISSAPEISPKLKKLLDSQGAAQISPAARGSVSSRGLRTARSSAQSSLADYYLVQYPATINVELLVEMLKQDPEVAAAQPVFVYRAMETYPPDKDEPDSNYNGRQDAFLNMIDAPKGWDLSTGNTEIKIAVLDTGLTHTGLAPRIRFGGYNTINDSTTYSDVDGHGTAVAGLIAALDWNSTIIPIKVIDVTGSSITVADGIDRAVLMSADIINMSLGGTGNDPILQEACANAQQNGALLVAAMGNEGNGVSLYDVVYPAAYKDVIGVGSIDRIGNLSWFSVRGTPPHTVEVVAPGQEMWTALHTGGYGYLRGNAVASSGTSFAAPLVSGLLGLMKAYYKEKEPAIASDNNQLIKILHNSSGPRGNYEEYGHGRINVYRALAMEAYGSYSEGKLERVLSFPNPAKNYLYFSFDAQLKVEDVEITIYDQRGNEITVLEYGSQIISGQYVTPQWDMRVNDKYLANGSYIYVVKATLSDGSVNYGRNVLTIVR